MFTTSIVRQQRFTFASQLALSCLAAIATLLFTVPAHAYQPEMDRE